jgi:hypothetical protein
VADRLMREFHTRHFRTSRQHDYEMSIKEENEGDNTSNGKNVENGEQHKLAGLKCQEKYGGPDDAYAEHEMAFWSDIPGDASYKSPFLTGEDEKFLTFEP